SVGGSVVGCQLSVALTSFAAERQALSILVNGKRIKVWCRNCSLFTIHRLRYFTLCAMRYTILCNGPRKTDHRL
ncbi:MAG: hypothetical protein PVH08_11315, partial [Syntrophobacterales bacterium]